MIDREAELEAQIEELRDKLERRQKRPYSDAMDAMLFREFPVGHTGGLVVPVDYMGNDAAIVEAARTSYGKGTKKVRGDRDLIRYLMRKWHTSPSEMVVLKLAVTVPMDTWRQWIRHRTASVNEYSTRYSEAIDMTATTKPYEWRSQSKDNKQGSGGYLPDGIGLELSRLEKELHEQARQVYKARLTAGVAREQARKDLPLSTYTRAYWKIDAHNLMHFLRLRLDSHAQKEIRDFAEAIAGIVKEWLPLTWEAFEDYRLNTVTFTRHEIEALEEILAGEDADVVIENSEGLSARERREFAEKLRGLAVHV